MRLLFRRSLPLLIIAIAVIGFIALKATKPKLPAAKPTERAWRVDVLSAQPTSHHPILTLYGKVDAPDEFTAVAPRTARVHDLPVQDGQFVSKGQLLVQLDPADFDPAVRQAEASVSEIKAQIDSENVRYLADQDALKQEQQILDNARKTLERNQNLASRKLASPTQVENAVDTMERARLSVTTRRQAINDHPSRLTLLQAKLKSAEAQLASAQRDQTRATVKAPFDGIVTDVQVAQGDQVNANAKLLSFYPRQDLQLRAIMPARYADELIQAVANQQPPKATARMNGMSYPLKLLRLAGSASGEGITGIFQFDDMIAGLRIGSVLTITLSRPAAAGTVAVPYSALYGSDRIYVVNGDRLKELTVDVVGDVPAPNKGTGRWLLIHSPDITASTQIATTHLPNAIDGLKVQVLDGNEGNAESRTNAS